MPTSLLHTDAEIKRTLVRHMDIAYRAKGHGPVLVLIHAFPLTQAMWAPQIAALADTCHVITLDLPGFGSSQAVDGDFSLDTLAEIVHELLQKLGHERAVVGGLSMGGYIALAYARKFPAHLQGLILADTKAGPDTPEARERRMKAIAEVEARGLRALAESHPRGVLTPATLVDHPELVKELGALIAGNNPMAVAGALRAMAERPDSADVLSGLHVPALVIVGEADDTTPPAEAEAMAAALAKARLVRIPGASHLSSLERPEEFNAAVKAFMEEIKG